MAVRSRKECRCSQSRRDIGKDGVAQLAVEVGGEVDVARAADLVEEDARIGDAVRVDSVTVQADSAKLLVADGDGGGRAPLLIDLQARGKEVDL